MAGIGFALKGLAREDTISSIVASFGHAAIVAAGPWLFTIASLAIVTLAAEPVAGIPTLADFRALVIYAFAISLVFSAPVTIIATRLVGDALWQRRPERVSGLLVGAYFCTIAPILLGVIACQYYFRLRTDVFLALAASTLVVGLIWAAITFCGAVRDYRGVTLSFLSGLLVSTGATITGAILGFQAVGLSLAFLMGLVVILVGLTGRVLATFPYPSDEPRAAVRAIVTGMQRYWRIALGAFFGATAVWIDKWVYWLSPIGEKVNIGLLHAPVYDSTMFIASLVIIPALSSFVVRLETGFFERYQEYFATIASHGTLDQIEHRRETLARYTMDSLTLITISLAALASILLLTAPVIVEALGLQFRQIAILRYGALGAIFQFVFIASISLLLFFDRRRRYLAIQFLYLVMNASLAALSLKLGEDYYGVGFFAAALIAALFAFRAADLTLDRLNFLTFIGNNPSVEGASFKRPSGLRRIFHRVSGS